VKRMHTQTDVRHIVKYRSILFVLFFLHRLHADKKQTGIILPFFEGHD